MLCRHCGLDHSDWYGCEMAKALGLVKPVLLKTEKTKSEIMSERMKEYWKRKRDAAKRSG